jgi:hypothetical protein
MLMSLDSVASESVSHSVAVAEEGQHDRPETGDVGSRDHRKQSI